MTIRRSRKHRPAPPASPVDLECVILAIDPGATSGWAIMAPHGSLLTIGIAKNAAARVDAVQLALQAARDRDLPLVVASEKWTAGGWRTASTPMGLGAQWGRWQEQLELAGHPARRIVRVYPQTWRGAVLGLSGSTKSADAKRASMRYVAARWPGVTVPTDDAADAVGIGAWAQRAGVVSALLPKRRAA